MKKGNKYLVLASTDKNKNILAKHSEIWNRIKYLIKTIDEEKYLLWKRLNENQDWNWWSVK